MKERYYGPTAVLAVALLSSMVAGCAGGLWPNLPDDGEAVAKARGAGTLEEALIYAEGVRKELDGGNDDAGNVKRGGAYVATAIGVGSGAAVLYKAGDAILRGLTVATAGVVGIDNVASPGAQLKIFEAGANAVECVVRAARDQATQGKNLFASGSSVKAALSFSDPQAVDAKFSAFGDIDAKPAIAAYATAGSNSSKAAILVSAFKKPIPHSVNSIDDYRAREYLIDFNAEVDALADYLRKLGTALEGLPNLVISSTAEIRRKVQRQLNAATPDLGEIADARRKAMVKMASELTSARDKMHPEKKKSPPPTNGGAGGASTALGTLEAAKPAVLNIVLAAAANVKEAGEPLAKTFDACTDSATVQAQQSGNKDKQGNSGKPEKSE